MDDSLKEFLEDFLSEAEEHLSTINNNLLTLEKQFKESGTIDEESVNSIFRAVHTIKGLAGMLGFDNVQVLAHAMEDLMGEIRQGSRELSENILDTLFESTDALNQQIEEIKSSGEVTTDPNFYVEKLRNILSGNVETAKEESQAEVAPSLDFLDFEIPIENFVPKEIEAAILQDAIEKDLNVYMVIKEITSDITEEKFNKLPIFNDIEKVGELIFYRPSIEDIHRSNKSSLFCYFVFMSEKPFEEIKNNFFDEIKVLRESKSSNVKKEEKKEEEGEAMAEENVEVFRLADTGFDESIVSEFFEEVDELIENLDMDLLELEKNPEDNEILNSIFRAAHTIKGASSMFGFEPIVKLTHAMENLFDNLRKGVMVADTYIMDTFFEGIDLLKDMLNSLKEEGIIDQNYLPIVKKINEIIENQGSPQGAKKEADIKEVTAEEETSHSVTDTDIQLNIDDNFKNFLPPEDLEKIKEEKNKGKNLIYIKVEYPEDILKSIFKPFEGLFTGLEIAGDVVSVYPDISKIPLIDDYEVDKFYFSLQIILSSTSSLEDVKMLLGGFEDTLKMEYSALEIIEKGEQATSTAPSQESVKEQEPMKKVEPTPAPTPVQPTTKPEPKKEVKPAPKKTDAKPAKSDKKDGAKKKMTSNTIRVDLERLDKLLNLVGEFVIDRTRFAQISQELREKYPHDPLIMQLNETNQIFGRHMNEIQEVIMSVRMIPIGNTFNKYPRIVRDLARESGKEINLEISGQETELDKTLVEEIGDPLVHLIRNSVDHGIEPPEERVKVGKPRVGTIKLSAHHEGNHIVISIEDDGRGIDPEKIRKKAIEKGLIKEDDILTKKEILNLIFEPGFSTAEKVTNISGRGVGMDVVKRNISKLKGIIDIDTEVGKGTTISIKLPLTLAIIQVLMVQVASEIFAVPLPSIIETIRITKEEIQKIEGYEMITLRDSVLPIARLKDIFQLDDKKLKGSLSYNNELDTEDTGKFFIVIVGLAEHRVGLIVDKLITQQEVVIKSLGSLLSHAKGIAGATILGNGKVALILDIAEVIEDSKQLNA